MSAEPQKRTWAWIGWALFAWLVLYPLSFFPLDVGLEWLRHSGVISGRYENAVVDTVYAPLIPIVRKSPGLDRLIQGTLRFLEPVRPGHHR
jgi:hypothetical protein